VPRVTRSRVVEAPVERIWELVSDPESMPRWWPLAVRVENVEEDAAGQIPAWTVVLRSEGGTAVRADFRRTEARPGKLFSWSQEVAGTPFARILKRASVEVAMRPDGAGARVALTSDETLRGLSRFGWAMVRNAARRRLDEALDGIERSVAGA
jgi:uncharacterized protein YndB with AHSA1/START domain